MTLLGDALISCALATVLGSGCFLALRYVFYAATYERLRLLLRRRGPGYEMYTPVVTEELWEGLGASVLVALGSWALASGHSAHCRLADTSACLLGWPHPAAPRALHGLFLLMLGWYGQCTVKRWAGPGRRVRVQGLDAALHHASTLALLALSYSVGLLRLGLLAHWLFTVTSPLLAASKLLHCLDVRPAKKVFFLVFAAAFFAARVLAVPLVLLRCTLYDAWLVPLDWRAAAAGNAGLLLLYCVSLFWFGRLLGILATGKLDGRPRMVLTAESRRWQKRL
ncbi:Ceramide synthase 5 [Tetrabaena socialis]|uniref:Ceramide synthase 5 n=1 Tax=Tetrabaena socialis TaxID=47790 RepID=A0A2J7ZYX1_9CHLO|nr:Ceramide synthase 5 [Tetrabaena socialis]|eukprot:PNH05469.1 Ceramide synthase 5 [Tetrabaena socialis]